MSAFFDVLIIIVSYRWSKIAFRHIFKLFPAFSSGILAVNEIFYIFNIHFIQCVPEKIVLGY